MALYIHCGAHISHLIASKAFVDSTNIRNSLNTVQDLGTVYNKSGYFKQQFKESSYSIKPLCPTRFLTRAPAVLTILNNYTDIITNLSTYANDGSTISPKTGGILANMKSPLFILG